MISAGDFRNGMTIELENNVYQIIEFQHVKPGKGAAFVRTKLKNIRTAVLWRRHSARQRSVLRHVLTDLTSSICIMMEICITLWIPRPTIR